MKCPICDSDTKVTNSRPATKGIRRKRECVECLTRFSTFETMIVESMEKYVQEKYKARMRDESIL